MTEDFSECIGSIIVFNKSTVIAPLTVEAYKSGIRLTSLSQILHPFNGISKYSQFFEVVNRIKNFVPPIESVVATVLELAVFAQCEICQEKLKKLNFIIRQLQLLKSKTYRTSDFCFAIETFPRCTYEHLREFRVLPSFCDKCVCMYVCIFLLFVRLGQGFWVIYGYMLEVYFILKMIHH